MRAFELTAAWAKCHMPPAIDVLACLAGQAFDGSNRSNGLITMTIPKSGCDIAARSSRGTKRHGSQDHALRA
jgi:hypothetical protein